MDYIMHFISQITPQGVLAGFILGGVLGFLAAREWYTAPGELTAEDLDELERLIQKAREIGRNGED